MPIGIGGGTKGTIAVAHLTSHNLTALQGCVGELYAEPEAAALPAHVVRSISRVIPAGVTSYATLTHGDGALVYRGLAACRDWERLDAFVRHMDEHPVLWFLHPGLLRPHRYGDEIDGALRRRLPFLPRAPHYAAARISDALPHRRYRSLGLYQEFFRRNEADYQLLVSFLPEEGGYSLVSLNRDRRDFTEEERLMLNLLAPHVAQASRNASARAQARRTLALVERGGSSSGAHRLTGRETDVLYWVAQGKTNAETAVILSMAPGTVKIHLERIYRKLGVENRTAASALARGLPERG